MKKLILGITLGLSLLMIGCEEAVQPTEEQLNCNHEWVEIDWDIDTSVIYCPKCTLEQRVSYKEWKKIKADMKYQMENK